MKNRCARIVGNAGWHEGAIVIEKISASNTDANFDSVTPPRRSTKDLVKSGVIDPTKVTRSALQNASSIAALYVDHRSHGGGKIPEKKSATTGAGRRAARSGYGLLRRIQKPEFRSQNVECPPFGAGLFYLVLRRFHSERQRTMPAATETFSDEMAPAIGMRTRTSQCFFTSWCRPWPSPPNTRTVGLA